MYTKKYHTEYPKILVEDMEQEIILVIVYFKFFEKNIEKNPRLSLFGVYTHSVLLQQGHDVTFSKNFPKILKNMKYL